MVVGRLHMVKILESPVCLTSSFSVYLEATRIATLTVAWMSRSSV